MPESKALMKSTENVDHSISFLICTFITCHYLQRFILCLSPARLEIPFLPHYRHHSNTTSDIPLKSFEYKQMRQTISGKES